jgi:hypothetical protein
MTEPGNCPKCDGMMSQGSLKERTLHGPSPYQWVPSDKAAFPLKGAESNRRDILMYRCQNCGYLESYAPSAQHQQPVPSG